MVEAQFKRRKQMQAQVVQKQPTQSDGDTNSSSTSSGSSSGSGVRLNTDKYIPNHRPEPHSAIKPIAMAAPAPVPTPQDPPTGTAPHDPIEDTFTYAALPGIEKFCLGIPSRVYGDKELIILTKEELQMLEDALPMDMQVRTPRSPYYRDPLDMTIFPPPYTHLTCHVCVVFDLAVSVL